MIYYYSYSVYGRKLHNQLPSSFMRLPLKGFQLPASHESDRIIRVHYPQGLWGFLPKVFDYLHHTDPTGSFTFIILKVYGASSQRSSITGITQIRQDPQVLWGFLPKVFAHLHQIDPTGSSSFMGLPPKGLRLPAPKNKIISQQVTP